MFDGRYLEWNQRRIKAIIDHYGHKFMYQKRVLDLGCGEGDLGGALYRLGANVTGVDARQEHLSIVNKKFTGMKTVKTDLDRGWPFIGTQFDLILDLGILCHLANFEVHLRDVCRSTHHLVLETAVFDSDDPYKCAPIPENKGIYDLSINGAGCRPTAAAIERVLTECGMTFKRVDSSKLNVGSYVYDWQVKNTGDTNLNNRRMWFAVSAQEQANRVHPGAGALVATPPEYLQNSHVPIHRAPPPTPAHPPPISLAPELPAQSFAYQSHPPNVYNPTDTNKKFVIVIPSYNNINWCEKNINSALSQNYPKFRIIFTDDMSTDGTFDKVSSIVASSNKAHLVSLVKNASRLGALHNLYNMIHSCADDEIILTLDGDDWFPDDDVLNKLNRIYSQEDIWMTYGQYRNSNDGGHGVAQAYPPQVIRSNSFRGHVWGASHLRTFYAWLFKKIRKEDLQRNNEFFPMTWDFAMMFPMLEMAGTHSKFLPDILYVYNLENPINDHKVNRSLQADLDRHIRAMPRYSPTTKPAPPKIQIGLMMIATGKYHRFIQGLISSADKYFIRENEFNVTYYVFTDTQPAIQSDRNVVVIPIEHRPFPHASMDRFKHFTNFADKLSKEDYLFYVDVDCLFVDHVSTEVIGDLVGVQHCGFFNRGGPIETNPSSSLYVNDSCPQKYKHYFGGGFSGGKRDQYLQLAKWCAEMIDKDTANGIVPIWHDETALNRYFLDHEPTIVLNPSYHYPQSNIEHYKRIWSPNIFRPKILLLDKNHGEVRG